VSLLLTLPHNPGRVPGFFLGWTTQAQSRHAQR